MKQPVLSIIIPAYQEAARIQSTLTQLGEFLDFHRYHDVEVLVVVANGTDKTAELAAAKAHLFPTFRIIMAGPRVGKGRDVRTGMMEAQGRYKLFMDADLATPLRHLHTVMKLIKHNPEIIIGVRDLNSSHQGLRKWVSNLGNWMVRHVLLSDITDSQCGFKLFRGDIASELFSRQRILGWGFDMELLTIARQHGYKIDMLEIPDWQDQPDGTFHQAVSLAALLTLVELMVIVWHRTSGSYRHKRYVYQRYEANN
ncbi:MAG TPA: glycosyltransferase [Candidatus Polarisedimenticolaceae bacterium]|nr:glycosyltransferase [Candidatus Polarisedimenticolaceae bacterium]